MTQLSPDDHDHLARAVALSREHMERGEGGPFGADRRPLSFEYRFYRGDSFRYRLSLSEDG